MVEKECTQAFVLRKCYSVSLIHATPSTVNSSPRHLGVGMEMQFSSFSHSVFDSFIKYLLNACVFMLGSGENNEREKMIFVLGDLRILERVEKLRYHRQISRHYNTV